MPIGEPLVRLKMPNSLFTFYTAPLAPAGLRVDIKTVEFINRDETNSSRIWLYLVEFGDVAGEDNGLIQGTEQWKVPAGRNLEKDTWKVLKPGGMIQGYSDGSVTLFVDGAIWTI